MHTFDRLFAPNIILNTFLMILVHRRRRCCHSVVQSVHKHKKSFFAFSRERKVQPLGTDCNSKHTIEVVTMDFRDSTTSEFLQTFFLLVLFFRLLWHSFLLSERAKGKSLYWSVEMLTRAKLYQLYSISEWGGRYKNVNGLPFLVIFRWKKGEKKTLLVTMEMFVCVVEDYIE